MSAKQRNFLIGATVLVALGIFIWFALEFGAKGAGGLLAPPQEEVVIDATRVDGLSEGSPVTYQGVNVGRIVRLARNASGNGVTITALFSKAPTRVPTNVNVEIVVTNLIGGGASLALELQPDPDGKLTPHIPPEGAAFPLLHAEYVGLKLNLLPGGADSMMTQISGALKKASDIEDQVQQRELVKHLDEAVQNFNAQTTRAGQVLQSIEDVIGDPAAKEDLRQTIASARKTAEGLARFSNEQLPQLSQQASDLIKEGHGTLQQTQQRVDELSRQIGGSVAKISQILDGVYAITDKINKGQGTAGLLISDPKLYQSLVDSSRELDANLKDIQRLVQQWEQDGLSLKMK